MKSVSLIIVLSLSVLAKSAAVVKRQTCSGNCADQKGSGIGNGQPSRPGILPSGQQGSSGKPTRIGNGNNNGNCKGNCIGNRNGNYNGNNNINSDNNGNGNGNCVGNCFHNRAGNRNGNNNTNVDNNGNANGNCWGNCFYRVGGNNNGNNNRGRLTAKQAIDGFIEETMAGAGKNNEDNCFGNCIAPQPMGKTADYDAEFKIAESPLTCSRVDGYSFYIMPGTYCLEIYRYPTKQSPSHGQLPQFACPAGTVFDLDICNCNHWYMVNLYHTCSSSYKEFNG